MIIEKITVGPLSTNCYIVGDEEGGECFVIDPGAEAERIVDSIKILNMKVKNIIATHCHYDHISAISEVGAATGAEILIHIEDAGLLNDSKKNLSFWFDVEEEFEIKKRFIKDGDILKIGKSRGEVIHTPGHTPGSISIKINKNIFTGDLIFAGSVGRTDLPGASQVKLFESIKKKILPLEDDMTILPGHGPETTLLKEKKENPFVKQLLNRS
ncbi:MAG: MBL fold metallo-hydrolase [Actinomycetia bacterium]|nr:MBL fold metallo-hydrolase [Actinomycetes bacterium]